MSEICNMTSEKEQAFNTIANFIEESLQINNGTPENNADMKKTDRFRACRGEWSFVILLFKLYLIYSYILM